VMEAEEGVEKDADHDEAREERQLAAFVSHAWTRE
jgi:hypothetical protein